MRNLTQSVSALLLVLVGFISAAALVSTALQMTGAFQSYRESLETNSLAAADETIFRGILALRNGRGDAQTALLGQDDPRAGLTAAEKSQQAGYESILAALDSAQFTGREDIAGALKQRWSEAAPQFHLFTDQLTLPRAERRIDRTDSWYKAMTKVIETANSASLAVSNRAWLNDPFIAASRRRRCPRAR